MPKRMKRTRRMTRSEKIAKLKAILKKLDSVENTVNASKVREIENMIDKVLRKHRIKHSEIGL